MRLKSESISWFESHRNSIPGHAAYSEPFRRGIICNPISPPEPWVDGANTALVSISGGSESSITAEGSGSGSGSGDLASSEAVGNQGQGPQNVHGASTVLRMHEDGPAQPPQLGLVCNPCQDPNYGGLFRPYGPWPMAYPSVGIPHGEVVLPLNLTDDGPIYVNAKQYHRILRRRQSRAKLEAQNKLIKFRKTYLHESRHIHAMSRPRGAGGRFLNPANIGGSNGTSEEKDAHEQTSQHLASGSNEIPLLPLPPPPLPAGGSSAASIRPGPMADQTRPGKIQQLDPGLKCPPCESTNTKFCYFNKYSFSLSCHFCKTCCRYWTKGGMLRNEQRSQGCRRSNGSSGSINCRENEPEAMQSQRKESAILQKENDKDFTREVETVTDPLTASEIDSHQSESDSELRDKKMKRGASSEHFEKVQIESAPLPMQQFGEPEAERQAIDAAIHVSVCGKEQKERLLKRHGIINYDAMVNCLIEHVGSSSIRKIGLCGKHEVGKAMMAEALKEAAVSWALFDKVICVSLPTNWDVEKVQMDIARQISSNLTEAKGIDISDLLTNAFRDIKILLILVDINQPIKQKTMRIPEPTWENGSKIVYVTTSEQLCHEMAVDHTISLDDLLSWQIFSQNVEEVVYSAEVQAIAREIVKICNHNSHAIILVARALRNVSDISIWKYALERLSPHEEDIESLMVNVLRLSIEHLKDDKSRKCLKHLVFCSKNLEIATESVIGQWIRNSIVDTYEEGQQVLKQLIDANLLEDGGNKEFVRFQDHDLHVLANLVYQPEEMQYFLMRGGLMLTEPPNQGEWQNAKEICLMHNEISHLPEEPMCYSLSKLFMQRNYKLRTVPSSFFNCMPALEVLNLSRTRIRSLPESISHLVSLKRLFLNECILLRSIPPAIGKLKQLELLDFEGTRVVNLPKEIEDLVNLTCLGVSISRAARYGKPSKGSDTAIPLGVISALSCLEELNLDVDFDAEWWEKCAEGIVREVCGLEQLSSIKFYFQRLELLGQFNQLRKLTEHPSFAQFRFLVGSHANRIMNRLPCDVKFELEWWDRYLRYINGVGVPREIKETLQNAEAFFLERHDTVEKLSEFGIKSMEQLKCCVLGECNQLEVLIDEANITYKEGGCKSAHYECICLGLLEYLYVYSMRNLRCILRGTVQKGFLSSLKSLTLCQCPKLTVIFTLEILYNLNNLEEIKTEDCPAITSLISLGSSRGTLLETSTFLPMLKKLSLHYVPELSSISCGVRIAPSLEQLSFYNCPSLRFLSAEEVAGEHLRKIRGESSWWKDLEWSGRDRFDRIFVPIDTCEVL